MRIKEARTPGTVMGTTRATMMGRIPEMAATTGMKGMKTVMAVSLLQVRAVNTDGSSCLSSNTIKAEAI